MSRTRFSLILLALVLILGVGIVLLRPRTPTWSDAEQATLRTLWLGSLPPLPADPSNHVADDAQAVLGPNCFRTPASVPTARSPVAPATCPT